MSNVRHKDIKHSLQTNGFSYAIIDDQPITRAEPESVLAEAARFGIGCETGFVSCTILSACLSISALGHSDRFQGIPQVSFFAEGSLQSSARPPVTAIAC